MADPNSPPPGARKAGIAVVAIVALMAVALFVGVNLDGAKSLREDQAGTPDPRSIPQTQTDLEKAPPRN